LMLDVLVNTSTLFLMTLVFKTLGIKRNNLLLSL